MDVEMPIQHLEYVNYGTEFDCCTTRILIMQFNFIILCHLETKNNRLDYQLGIE